MHSTHMETFAVSIHEFINFQNKGLLNMQVCHVLRLALETISSSSLGILCKTRAKCSKMDRKLQSIAPSVNSGFGSRSRHLSDPITAIQQTEG